MSTRSDAGKHLNPLKEPSSVSKDEVFILLLMFARGTCLGASLVCIVVCTVADDSPTSDETGPVAEGVYSIGILMCVLCVNVFIVVEELWEGFKTTQQLPCISLLGLLFAAYSARGVWEGSIIYNLYTPSHLGAVN